jgi:hypothetical protein
VGGAPGGLPEIISKVVDGINHAGLSACEFVSVQSGATLPRLDLVDIRIVEATR